MRNETKTDEAYVYAFKIIDVLALYWLDTNIKETEASIQAHSLDHTKDHQILARLYELKAKVKRGDIILTVEIVKKLLIELQIPLSL